MMETLKELQAAWNKEADWGDAVPADYYGKLIQHIRGLPALPVESEVPDPEPFF